MFSSGGSASAASSGLNDGLIYDFEDEENAAKWKGIFVASLQKVPPTMQQLRPNTSP